MKHGNSLPRRYLALWLPYLSTDRIRRREQAAGQAPDNAPMVVVGRRENALRIVAADRAATGLGLVPGLGFADARARVPHMRVANEDEKSDHALMEGLASWCGRYTPVFAQDLPKGLMLEISGSAHLFGGEAALMDDLVSRLEKMGLTALATIAGTTQSARALCRFGRHGTIAPTGMEQSHVMRLPVEALEVCEKTTIALKRAGLKRVDDLATRPRKPLAARFGETLTLRLAQILGEIDRPLVPLRPEPDFFAECRFADPIGLSSDIDHALSSLAHQLCEMLSSRERGGRAFAVNFFRADGTVHCIDVLSGAPLRHANTLLRLIALRLDALRDPLDPGFGFDMIRIEVTDNDVSVATQPDLSGDEGSERSLLELVDRLSARFGSQSVIRFAPKGSHLPERAVTGIPALETPAQQWPAIASRPPRPLFLFSPAEPIEALFEVPDGPPRRFRWRGSLYDTVHVEGPERIAPEWWRAKKDVLTRDYFRIEDASGRRFWVFRYGLYGREPEPVRWFIHGVFP